VPSYRRRDGIIQHAAANKSRFGSFPARKTATEGARIAARVHSRANYLREIAAAVQGGPIFLRRLYFRMDARGKRERRGAPLYKMCLRYSFRRARAAAPWKISYVHLREEEMQAGRDSVEKKKLRNPLA